MANLVDWAQAMKIRRQILGLNQEDMANILGISQRMVAYLENNERWRWDYKIRMAIQFPELWPHLIAEMRTIPVPRGPDIDRLKAGKYAAEQEEE